MLIDVVDIEEEDEKKDPLKICDNFKRKCNNYENDNFSNICKTKQLKYDSLESNNYCNKKKDFLNESEDVMCIETIELQTSNDKNDYCVTSNVKVNNNQLKLVPPLRLKKVVQEVSIDQSNDNDSFSSEIETSNYKIISQYPVSDLTQVLVSTTLTSNEASYMPENYIDKICITFPSISELGIQESYEITGSNFMATMTSEITNTGQNPTVDNSASTLTRKYKENINKSSNSSSDKILEHNIIDLHPTTKKFIIKSGGEVTPVTLNKTFESPNQSTISIITSNKEIKLEEIVQESIDKRRTTCFEMNENKYEILCTNEIETKDIKDSIIKYDDSISKDDKTLLLKDKSYGDNSKEQEVDIQSKIQFQEHLTLCEEEMEMLSKMMKNSPNENVKDNENVQTRKVKNSCYLSNKNIRSPSLSPPKLAPTTPIDLQRLKSPSEMRNSPPVLPRICSTFSTEPEVICGTQSIKNCKSHNSEKIDHSQNKSSHPRPKIKIHDDECVELTLLMKPMDNTDTKNTEKCSYECNVSSEFQELINSNGQNITKQEEFNNGSTLVIFDKSITEPITETDSRILNHYDNNVLIISDINEYHKSLPEVSMNGNGYSSRSTDLNINENFNNKTMTVKSKLSKKRYKKYANKTVVNSPCAMAGSTTTILNSPKPRGIPKIIKNDLIFPTRPPNVNVENSDAVFGDLASTSCCNLKSSSSNICGQSNASQESSASSSNSNSITPFNAMSTSIAYAPSWIHCNNNSLININTLPNIDNSANDNDDRNQINSTIVITASTSNTNHGSKIVSQPQIALVKNSLSPTSSSNVSPNKLYMTKKNIIDQFPTFGTWAANMAQKDPTRYKKKYNTELKSNTNSLQNGEAVEYLPIQNNVNYRQKHISAAEVPQYYSNNYKIIPYSTVIGYHQPYPYGPKLCCAPKQPVSAVEVQRTPLESLRNITYPTTSILHQTDTRISNYSGSRNITEHSRIPNSYSSSALERQSYLNPEYLRPTYNNCNLQTDSQHSRSTFKKPSNSKQLDVEASYYGFDQSAGQKKQLDELLVKSSLLREQQIIVANSRNERIYRPEHSTILTNDIVTSTASSTIVNNPVLYTTNSRGQTKMKEPIFVGRTCPTPILGKIKKYIGASQRLKCYNCGFVNSSYQCLGCETAIYCNEACQAQHWMQHISKCFKIMPKLKKIV